MYRTDFCTLWEKARVGWSERIALKHIYYQVWNRSPVQIGCMRQVLRAGALGRPRGMGWRGRWEGESGWGTHVNPCLIHVNVWQKPLQYCKVISLQLIKKKKSTYKDTMTLCIYRLLCVRGSSGANQEICFFSKPSSLRVKSSNYIKYYMIWADSSQRRIH